MVSAQRVTRASGKACAPAHYCFFFTGQPPGKQPAWSLIILPCATLFGLEDHRGLVQKIVSTTIPPWSARLSEFVGAFESVRRVPAITEYRGTFLGESSVSDATANSDFLRSTPGPDATVLRRDPAAGSALPERFSVQEIRFTRRHRSSAGPLRGPRERVRPPGAFGIRHGPNDSRTVVEHLSACCARTAPFSKNQCVEKLGFLLRCARLKLNNK